MFRLSARDAGFGSARAYAMTLLLAVSLFFAAAPGTTAATKAAGAEIARQSASPSQSTHVLIQNVGQFAPDARYFLAQGDQRIWLTDEAIWLTVPDAAPASQPAVRGSQRLPAKSAASGTAIRFTFAGANPHPILEPFGPLATRVSYLIGNDQSRWHRDVPAWSGVRYRNLFPGVDLVVGGGEAGVVPWRFEARSGADFRPVALRAEGADSVFANRDALILSMKGKQLSVAAPAWSVDGKPLRAAVTVQAAGPDTLALLPGTQGQLAVSPSAPSAPTAGDLIYSAGIGGSVDDSGYGIAVDAEGSAYVTGLTRSTNLPVTAGAYDLSNDGTDELADAFVAKLDSSGSTLVYLTYLGGTGYDAGFGIAVDGNLAYVTGETNSQDFAGTSMDTVYTDIFVAALNATGTGVNYLTRLSGSADDTAAGIAVAGSEAYIAGTTSSSDLPGATNCVADTGTNVLVAKLNTAGAPAYTTCLAGSNNESGAAIAVRSDVAYITGDSQTLDYKTSDMLVATFAANGTHSASALIGGTDYDWGTGISVDPSGNVYVAGSTYSANFPVSSGTRPFGGSNDAVVMKLLPALTIDFATFIGGNGSDEASGIAIDTVQALYVTGTTDSTNFPTTAGAYDTNANGGTDLFVMRIHLSSSDPGKLTYSTYLGQEYADFGFDVATDGGSNAFVTGISALGADVEATDALVAKLKMSNAPDAPIVTIEADGADAELSWLPVTGAIKYQVFASETPYALPGGSSAPLAEPTATSSSDNGALSQAGSSFYVVKAVNSVPAAGPNSNEVGAFTFKLQPGSN